MRIRYLLADIVFLFSAAWCITHITLLEQRVSDVGQYCLVMESLLSTEYRDEGEGYHR
jgi:hypothetical protein